MSAPALEGDHRTKLASAIAFAERNRIRADAIAAEIKERVQHELAQRYTAIEMRAPRLRREIDIIADTRIGADSRWKLAVANEHWGNEIATMYAAVVLTEQSDFSIGQSAVIINLLGEIRDALRAKSS